MSPKLLIEQHSEFLSLKGACTGSSESSHVKMPHCWKSHVAAHMWKIDIFIEKVRHGGFTIQVLKVTFVVIHLRSHFLICILSVYCSIFIDRYKSWPC